MNPISLLSRWFGGDDASAQIKVAVAAAQGGRLDAAAESWRRAVAMQPVLIPSEAEMAALAPVLPLVAREVLARLASADGTGKRGWKLERRGAFDGEERWKLLQERFDELPKLVPTLRFVAQAIAHTADAPGRVRFDCDRPERDTEAYLDVVQMGEVVISWDESRRITDVMVRE
jgi:hypothetical protein